MAEESKVVKKPSPHKKEEKKPEPTLTPAPVEDTLTRGERIALAFVNRAR